MVRFFSAAIITLFLADSSDIYAASIVGGGLRHGKKQLSVVRRTLSEECVIVVVKRIDEKVFGEPGCCFSPRDSPFRSSIVQTYHGLSATSTVFLFPFSILYSILQSVSWTPLTPTASWALGAPFRPRPGRWPI